ncbi:cystatin-like [Rhinoderma darwinii]|uniref:cystatin-like n=1 Tax=Rhinoderma darwinii TaxID=43563 RepID=UPI003F661AD3
MARLFIVVAVLACLSAVTQAGPMLGGWEKADPNSSGVKRALAFALYEYNKGSNDMFAARAVKVNRAEKQLVSGINFRLDVDIGRTQCKKPTTDVNSCELHRDPSFSKISTCRFEVFTVPWGSINEIKKSECN